MAAELPEGFTLIDEPVAQPQSELPPGFTLVDEQPPAQVQPPPTPQLTLEPVPQPRPSMVDVFNNLNEGRYSPAAAAAARELLTRQLGAEAMTLPTGQLGAPTETRGISAGPQFREDGIQLPGFAEPIATLATGAIAEPIAGIAGMAAGVLPGEEGQAERAVKATREALTYEPKTEMGQKIVSDIGRVLQPMAEFVGEIETKLGDTVYDATGSPTLAAAATTIPTALTEAIGFASGRSAIRATRAAKKRLKEGKIAREINEAVPTIEQLKEASRGVYKEIDEMGVSVNSNAYDNLVNQMAMNAKKAGLDPDITPKAQKALNRFEELKGQDVPLSDVDTLRKVAQNAASSLEPAEAALGVKMIETIDDFLDQADPFMLKMPKHIDGSNVGKRYKIARDMWGRARKSELLQDAFEKARNQATGFENGVRTQFRAILNNKKKSRFFSRDELAAIKRVVRGDKKQNMAKLIGRLGFSEGGATNVLGGAVGMGAGAAVGGTPGALIVPIIGQVSRKLAQRMTAKGAEFADQVIRAGRNAREITEAYLKNTPRAQRSSQELSELLVRNDIDLVGLPESDMINRAAMLASQRRAELTGAIAAAAPAPTEAQREVEQ